MSQNMNQHLRQSLNNLKQSFTAFKETSATPQNRKVDSNIQATPPQPVYIQQTNASPSNAQKVQQMSTALIENNRITLSA